LSDLKNFDLESKKNIEKMATDKSVKNKSQEWIDKTGPYKYVYNWRWLGLPLIQLPADIVATQELIWTVKPTVIIETGIARGGSLIFNASQLALLDLCENGFVDAKDSKRKCIGIDIDIRSHNREAIEGHPLAAMIHLIEGPSTDDNVLEQINKLIKPDDRVMVVLDSNHTHDHVLLELNKYSPLVTAESYLIVHDTGIEFTQQDAFPDRDWGIGNNPYTAVQSFIKTNPHFVIDEVVCGKLLITSSPSGYLQRQQTN
jgi:cephalosporin hydroxylase